MNVETYGIIAVAFVTVSVPLAIWAYKKYKLITADGKVTLKEVMQAIKEGTARAKEAKELYDDKVK
tara:strand:- start:140 stop:337 length:198 start_codon:yes stop_codon:yes gene_type:complete